LLFIKIKKKQKIDWMGADDMIIYKVGL